MWLKRHDACHKRGKSLSRNPMILIRYINLTKKSSDAPFFIPYAVIFIYLLHLGVKKTLYHSLKASLLDGYICIVVIDIFSVETEKG